MTRETLQPSGEVLEVILPLGEEDRRTSLFERLNDIVEDEPILLLVSRELRVEFLDAQRPTSAVVNPVSRTTSCLL